MTKLDNVQAILEKFRLVQTHGITVCDLFHFVSLVLKGFAGFVHVFFFFRDTRVCLLGVDFLITVI